MPANQSTPEVTSHAADILDQYASFIRNDVKADDFERHPYVPEIEETAQALRDLATPARGGDELREAVARIIDSDAFATHPFDPDRCEDFIAAVEQAAENALAKADVILALTSTSMFDAASSNAGASLAAEFKRLHEAARGCDFDLTPADGPIAQLTLFVHENGDTLAAALASTDMAGASVPDRLARRMGAEFVRRDAAPQVEGLTSGEVDATGWHVNPHTPSVIITPHGRISIGWSVQAEGSSNDYSLAEAAAALIVKAVSSLAASPKAAATASVREDCAAACDRIATGSVYIGESEEGRARHEGIIAGARNCAAAIRRLTDIGTAATIGGERA